MDESSLNIIGAGLAGVEAAWGLANRGFKIALFEAKPKWFSPAHKSEKFAELVCSNSLKSEEEGSASALLKEEMRALGSIVLEGADTAKVPAGKALAVDRGAFSEYITGKISSHPNIRVVHDIVSAPPSNSLPRGEGELVNCATIIATGPLTHPSLIQNLQSDLTPQTLYFYDAIAPIIEADSINMDVAYRASRYGAGKTAEGDYINCPMSEEQYYEFVEALLCSEKVEAHEFDDIKCFEGCMPIEVMAARHRDALRFGPMKPMGLNDPRSGVRPFAVVQLRQDNLHGTIFNMVGFQTRMKYPEQERIFRKIPGLESAEFSRLGSMHRNTYINGPLLLDESLQLKSRPGIYFAGQITGVEGYLESAATGIYLSCVLSTHNGCGEKCNFLGGGQKCPDARRPQTREEAYLNGTLTKRVQRATTQMGVFHHPHNAFPPTTAIGALINHVTRGDAKNYQPMKMMWGIFPALDGHPSTSRGPGRDERKKLFLARARKDFISVKIDAK